MYATVPVESPNFAGHESFPMRFAWLKKGYDALIDDPGFFRAPDAIVTLGVGKNMVRAIRHWGLTCGVWEEVPGTRGRDIEPTELGHALLREEGWDPYLEEIGTIWWLHWNVVASQTKATTWSWVFGRPRGNRFSRDVIVGELEDLAAFHDFKRAKRSSLKRDLDVLLKSYVKRKPKRGAIEDALDNPFVMLGLIRPAVERGEYELVQGPHPSLPLGIFEAAVVDYCSRGEIERRAINLDELLYAPLAPGRTFRLSPDAFMERLLKLDASSASYQFDDTAGLRQLLLPRGLPDVLEVLDKHYEGSHAIIEEAA